MIRCVIEGRLPKSFGLARRELRRAAQFFAARSAAASGLVFREVAVVLQDNRFSATTHAAINGAEGPTDVTTQAYMPIPPEPPGVYGELYVNTDRAAECAAARAQWPAHRELLLYVAHGMDHLGGADDLSPADRRRMRQRELRWLREWARRQEGEL